MSLIFEKRERTNLDRVNDAKKIIGNKYHISYEYGVDFVYLFLKERRRWWNLLCNVDVAEIFLYRDGFHKAKIYSKKHFHEMVKILEKVNERFRGDITVIKYYETEGESNETNPS